MAAAPGSGGRRGAGTDTLAGRLSECAQRTPYCEEIVQELTAARAATKMAIERRLLGWRQLAVEEP